jgi:hypothetical protein
LGHTLVWRDTAQLYAPHRPGIVESLRAFRVPSWNPLEGTGHALFAQGLHSVLHPVSLAVAAFTPFIDPVLVTLIAFAALGTWAAARTLGLSSAAAAGAAFAFSMSGYVLGMSANALYLFGSASGPWAVWGLVLAARHRLGWIAAAAGVVTLALSGDAGSLTAFTLAGASLSLCAGGWRGLLRASAGAVLGLGAAAVQLVPSWRYLAGTSRGVGVLDPGSVHRWALAPWRVVELVAPGFFVGVPRSYLAPVFSALDPGATDRFPFASSVFVGAPVLVLAILGARRNRSARWLLALAVFFLWLALGHHAGSQDLLARVPVWGVLRYWEKMVGPLALCVALAAGAGIDAAYDGGASRTARYAAVGAVLGAAFLLALVFVPGAAPGGDPGVADAVRARLQVGVVHAAIGLAALCGAAVLGRRWPRALPGALVLVVFLQSAAASPFALHAGNPAVLSVRPPPIASAPPGPRIVAPLGFDFSEGGAGLDAIDRLQYWEGRSGRASTNVAAGVDSLAVYTGLTSVRWDMIFGSGPFFWPLSRRFATTHVVGYPPSSAGELDAIGPATAGALRVEPFDRGQLLVWEVPHRAWAAFAPSVRVAPDLQAAGEILGEELAAGRSTVVLECRSLPPVSDGRVLSVSRGADELSIEAESAGDSVLVVNDAWAPGWNAWIDGQPTEIVPADVLVRAVRFPAGRHRLMMRYQPPGWWAGVGTSSLALAVGVAVLAWQRSRGHRRRVLSDAQGIRSPESQ